MTISAFITATRPERRGDTFYECLVSANGFADEVVMVDGDLTWPQEFSWPVISEHFQRGYEQATGDWVFHLDTDFIFHERDYLAIRRACADNPDAPALTFLKHQFVLPDRFNLKSRLVLAVNKKKYGNRIKFNSGGDLCQPSLDGEYIQPGTVPDVRIPFYNYEKLIKTHAQIADDVGRMNRAYHSYFGEWLYAYNATDASAARGWLDMMIGRFNKPQEHIKLEAHPKIMQPLIANLTPDQWGYDGHGFLGRNDYVKNS